ncbi:MAG: MerR family transcriptional regulator [Chlamydiia bacterium]
MTYTVQKLAKLSGVSVRTLHYYDEIGLLSPAFVESNGYRYYGEKQLLELQQILFFRELGFELKKIQKILGKGDFDKVAALRSHRNVLYSNIERTEKLIQTIDKTIDHLTGGKKMKDQEMYCGFLTKEQQAEYQQYLKNRLGPEDSTIEESENNVKNWTKGDWEKSNKEFDAICKALAKAMEEGLKIDSPEVQSIVALHHKWIKQFWTPNRESYKGLGLGYMEFEWRKAFASYDPHHPRLAKFLAKAMEVFADRELSE